MSKIEVSAKEKKLLYDILNGLQCNMLQKIMPHLDALTRLYGADSELAQQWVKESVAEYDLIATLKAKMSEEKCLK
jgi:pantothenate kinase-related protein Tda10